MPVKYARWTMGCVWGRMKMEHHCYRGSAPLFSQFRIMRALDFQFYVTEEREKKTITYVKHIYCIHDSAGSIAATTQKLNECA